MDLITYGLKYRLLTPVEARKAQQIRNQNMKAYFDYLNRFDFLQHFQNENFELSPPTKITRPDSLDHPSETHEILPLCWKLLEEGVISATALNQEILALSSNERTPHTLLQMLFKNKKIVLQQFVDLYPFIVNQEVKQAEGYQVSFHPEGFPVFSQPETIAQFGAFQILEQLGQGGMGTVFKAVDAMNRTVALKKLNTEREDSPLGRQRFHNEAQVMAAIDNHPNVVRIYDYGTIENADYISMEYVAGHTLSEYLYEKPISLRTKIEFLYQISQALCFLHSKKIWHRDLKPLNIMVTLQNQIKVMDFGLAKVEQQSFTKTGTLIGTPNYMSPEQIDSKRFGKPSFQSDIFSFGIIFYEMLAGKLPFVGMSLTETLRQILEKPPISPRIRNLNIPFDLELICFRCLEKSPKERYATMEEIAAELERWLKGFPIKTKRASIFERTHKWAKRNRMVVSAAGIILLSLGSFYGYTRFNAYQRSQQQLHALDQEARQFQNDAEESLKQQKQAEHLTFLLQSLNTLNLLLSLAPKYPEARLQKFKVGKQLIEIFCSKQEYEFSSYLAQDMKEISETLKKEDLMQQVQIQKNKESQEHLERFEMWMEKLQQHTVENTDREDAIYEVSHMSEPEIFQRLLKYLEEGTEYFLKNPVREFHLKNFYITMVKILERLGNQDAAKSLITALGQIKKQHTLQKLAFTELDFATHIASALGRLQAVEALKPLEEFSEMLGANHSISISFQKACKKILQVEKKEIQEINLGEFQKGKNAFIAGRLDESFAIFEEILKQKPTFEEAYFFAEAYFYRGRIYQAKQSWKEALKDYNLTIHFCPEYPALYNQRGQVREILKDAKGALEDFQKAIFLDPNYAEAYINLGIFQFHQENFELAFFNYDKAIQINPMIPDAYYNRGVMRRRLEQYDEAIRDFNETIRLNNQHTEAYIGRAKIFLVYQQYPDALKDYNRAIQLKPEYPNIYFHRGVLKEKLEDYQGALEDFLKAIQLNPEYALAYAHCCINLEQLGKFPEADQAYQKAIQIDPSLADKIRKKK